MVKVSAGMQIILIYWKLNWHEQIKVASIYDFQNRISKALAMAAIHLNLSFMSVLFTNFSFLRRYEISLYIRVF